MRFELWNHLSQNFLQIITLIGPETENSQPHDANVGGGGGRQKHSAGARGSPPRMRENNISHCNVLRREKSS